MAEPGIYGIFLTGPKELVMTDEARARIALSIEAVADGYENISDEHVTRLTDAAGTLTEDMLMDIEGAIAGRSVEDIEKQVQDLWIGKHGNVNCTALADGRWIVFVGCFIDSFGNYDEPNCYKLAYALDALKAWELMGVE